MAVFSCNYDAAVTPFLHYWEQVVGSGHAPLALRADWQAQIARCHTDLGFSHVRFHGILSYPMDVVSKQEDELEFSFFNIDQVVDYLRSIDMRPFVEPSYMPEDLAAGDETVFHYASNITPPADVTQWSKTVSALIKHWEERYGSDEVRQWFFEVWNEPNYPQQFAGSQADYFELYRHTAEAIKAVDPALRVGGPASSDNEWIPAFLAFCEANGLPVDFVSTHHYPDDAAGEGSGPTQEKLSKIERSVLREQTRKAHGEANGKPLYYTEWNTSSNHRDDLHDQPYAAAFVVKTVMEAAGLVEGYSFWTFSDIFQEYPMPSKPFHGGFGLLNLHGIAKPTYRAYGLLHTIGTEQIPVVGTHETVDAWAVRGDERLDLVMTNHALPGHEISSETIQWRIEGGPLPTQVRLARIDEKHGNPRHAWSEMGEPTYPTAEQFAALHAASVVDDESLPWRHQDGTVELAVDMPPHSVAVITLDYSNGAKPSGVGLAGAQTGVTGDEGIAKDGEFLNTLLRATAIFFSKERDEDSGLLPDSTKEDSSASVMSVAMAIPVYIVEVERGFLAREEAVERICHVLRLFWYGAQGPEPVVMGYKGSFYHFLDMANGLRVQSSELSTIDTAFFIAGALTAGSYFDQDTPLECEIRELADKLYRRIDWQWAQNGRQLVSMGWSPEKGFEKNYWEGYSEALMLYVLALASPTHPIGPEAYEAWLETYEWKNVYGQEYVHASPLFIHQFSHAWIDFRGIQDRYMREKGIDYFENSRRATLAQQAYAIANPHGYNEYGEFAWGITAAAGPADEYRMVDGTMRKFFEYEARGIPDGPDDGTLAPSAAAASLPFAPEIVLPTVRNIHDTYPEARNNYGFLSSFNATYPEPHAGRAGWVSDLYYGLDQGPVIMMVENYETGLIWRLMQRCPWIVQGLKRAGLTSGWLSGTGIGD